MKIASSIRGRALRYLVPFLAVSIVAGSVFVSGVARHGGAKDIDTRYFYVAAKCWAAGESPYDPAKYDAMFRSTFGSHPDALFVAYFPTLMLVALPTAPFDWPVAARLFSLMNFGAAMVLFWACYRLVRESIGSPLRPKHWFWVVLASTVGGIAGTVFTGQTSVFITAACALAIIGCRLKRAWLTVIGLVIATAKPHLSFPLLLYIPLFEPQQRRAVAIAVGVAAIPVAYAAIVDSNLSHNYLDSIRVYNSLPTNDPLKLIGAVSLLVRVGIARNIAQWLGVLCLTLVLGLTAWVVRHSRESLTRIPVALMLLIFSIGIARSIQGYDLSCYAVGIALLATVGLRSQCALLIPALVLWRPALLGRLHGIASGPPIATVAWLGLLIGSLIIAGFQLRSDSESRTLYLAAEGESGCGIC